MSSMVSINEIKCSEVNLHVYSVSWSLEDYTDMLKTILNGTSAEFVEKKFVHYVTENIEPVGWRAIWRPLNQHYFEILKLKNQSLDFLIYVDQVNLNSLEALITIKDIASKIPVPDDHTLNEKQLKVPITELHPTVIQEHENISIETTAEVIEQIRFFYHHIWLPWDLYEEVCCFDEDLIRKRAKIYEDMMKEAIPAVVSAEMKKMRSEAESVVCAIRKIEADTQVACDNEIDDLDLAKLFKLNRRLEDLKDQYQTLSDPALREVASLRDFIERKDLLSSYLPGGDAGHCIFVCASSSTNMLDFVHHISKLKEALEGICEYTSSTRLQTFPTLQMALDAASAGNVIVLLPGNHVLRQLGPMAAGGAICGLGEGVVISGCLSTGDVLLDLNVAKDSTFTLTNITMKPIENQTSIFVHSGQVSMKTCWIKGGSVGVCLLSKAEMRIEETTIEGSSCGVDCRSNFGFEVDHVTIVGCPKAMVFSNTYVKIKLLSSLHVRNCDGGVYFKTGTKSVESSSNEEDNLMNRVFSDVSKIQFENVERNCILMPFLDTKEDVITLRTISSD